MSCLKDEVERIARQRQQVSERLRRLALAFVDGFLPDEEYRRQKRTLEMELESLVVPEASAAEGAGRLLLDLPKLWAGASLEERRRLPLTMLDAVYVDAKEDRSIVAVKPKAAFRPVFQVAVTREGSGVVMVNEPPGEAPEARRCFWWRRGRVELHLEHRMMVLVQAA